MAFEIGSIIARVKADVSDFKKGMDNVGDQTKKTSLSVTDSSKAMAGALRNNLLPLLVGGGAIAMGFKQVTRNAMEFESAMSNVSTLITGDSTEAIAELTGEVLAMAKAMPKSVDELGGSLYDILSAGVQGTAEQMLVLESSAKLATAGLGDTKGATDLMTSAINAFQIPADQANDIADILFKTVKNGKTTVDQMAQSFGATAPVIASAGILLEEFSAAVAALTTTGQPASQAQNSLRQSVVALSKPTKEMADLFAKAGIESGEAALKQDGLVSVMQRVTEAADGNQEMLARAWGSVEALGASTALTGQVYDTFASTFDDMAGSTNALDEAFEKQKATTESSMQLLKNSLDVVSIELGSRFLPMLGKVASFLAENLGPIITKVSNFLINNKEVLAAIAIGIMAMLVPAFVAWAIAAGVAAINTLILFAPLILLGAAVAAAAYIIMKNWDWIMEKTEGLRKMFKSIFEWIYNFLVGGSIIPDLVNKIINLFTKLLNFLINTLFGMQKFIIETWIKIAKMVINTLFGMQKFIIETWIKIAKMVINLAQNILTGVKGKFEDMVGVLKSIGGKIKDAIIQPFTQAWEKVSEIANKIKDKLDFTKRQSPSVLDIVESGVDRVNRAFEGLITPSVTFAGSSNGVGGGSTQQGTQNININVGQVGDMQDVYAIGRELGFRTELDSRMFEN